MGEVARQSVPLVAALVVLFGVWLTVRQKDHIDHKEQWWKRVQWSAELVMSRDENQRVIGMSALVSLIDSTKKIDPQDVDLLQAIIDQVDVQGHSRSEPNGRDQ